jgi:hypothetical protein
MKIKRWCACAVTLTRCGSGSGGGGAQGRKAVAGLDLGAGLASAGGARHGLGACSLGHVTGEEHIWQRACPGCEDRHVYM